MLPILYQSPDLILYSYPLLMGLGWGVAYQIFFGLVPSSESRVKAQFLYWGIFLFAWVGAKILFLTTLPDDISSNLMSETSFWVGGGFVFYGGFLATLIFLILFRLYEKKWNINLLWPLVPATVFGHAIGRVGCFLAGCCYGHETDLPWGIHLHGVSRHPTQLIEASLLFIFGFYLLKSKQDKLKLILKYFLFYGVLRFGLEFLRGDSIRGSWGALTPSQWISVGLTGLAITLLNLRNIHNLKEATAK